VCRAGHAVCC